MAYELVILSHDDPSYRHVISKRGTERELVKTEDGVNINLNHEKYCTFIEEVDDED